MKGFNYMTNPLKIIIISSGVILISIVLMIIAMSPEKPSATKQITTPTTDITPDSQASPNDESSRKKYILKIENSSIYAYEISGSQKIIVQCADIETFHLTPVEIQKLSGGIEASSFEELCLYFESYTS